MRRRKKKSISRLTSLFIIFLFTISTGYSLLSEQLQVTGKAAAVVNTVKEKIKFTYTKNIWGENPYTVQFDINIQNISDEIYNGWEIYIPIPEGTKIISNWGTIAEIQDNKLILKNEGYNASFGIDSQIAFGIQLSCYDPNIELLNPYFDSLSEEVKPTITVDNNNISINYNKTGSWQHEGYYYKAYEMIITNKSETIITSWNIKINRNENVLLDSGWNANYIEKTDLFIFSNESYNGTILPENQVAFSFIVKTTDNKYEPVISSFECIE